MFIIYDEFGIEMDKYKIKAMYTLKMNGLDMYKTYMSTISYLFLNLLDNQNKLKNRSYVWGDF